MVTLIQPPDLLIYLRSTVPNLVNQIQKRGRKYENTIRIDYLTRLNERYEAWITSYNFSKLLVVDVDNTNFSENPLHLREVINKIDAKIKPFLDFYRDLSQDYTATFEVSALKGTNINHLVKKLFELEVPEINDGIVEIKSIS